MSNESARQNSASELVKVGQASETGEGVRMMRGRDEAGWCESGCLCVWAVQSKAVYQSYQFAAILCAGHLPDPPCCYV